MGDRLDMTQERLQDVRLQHRKLEQRQAADKRLLDRVRERTDDRRKLIKKTGERERELDRLVEDLRDAERLKRLWNERACLDGTTTWIGLKLCVVTIGAKTSWEGTLVAADRTSHADDCGDRSSQAELWAAYKNGTGNPANPPGTSSHEGINGGNGGSPVTTKVPTGAKLPPWMWGLDVGGDGNLFLAGARKLGFDVRQMPGETWHFNFMSDPTPVLKRLRVI